MKTELLSFISANMTDSNHLVIHTTMDDGRICDMLIKVPKARTIEIISTCFSDELVGTMPHGTIEHQITSWTVE